MERVEYGLDPKSVGLVPEGVVCTLRTADDGRLSDLTVLANGVDIGGVARMRVNRLRKDGAGIASALRWCSFSHGWAPEWAGEDLFGAKIESGYPIGEGFDDRMEAAIALLKVWDEAGRPNEGNSNAGTPQDFNP